MLPTVIQIDDDSDFHSLNWVHYGCPQKETQAICLMESEQRFLFLHQLLVVSLSVRIIAAVLQIQFHSEWLEVMWLGQTWAERLSTRLKQQRCLRTATLHHPRDKSLNMNIIMDLTEILNTAYELFTQKCEVCGLRIWNCLRGFISIGKMIFIAILFSSVSLCSV